MWGRGICWVGTGSNTGGRRAERTGRRRCGRQCLETGNWRADVPAVLVEVHKEIGLDEARLAISSFRQPTYYTQPGVWEDLKTYYDGYLQMYPEGRRRLNEYAKAACEAKQW